MKGKTSIESFEEATFMVISEIGDMNEQDMVLTAIVDIMGIVFEMPREELDEFQNEIFKRLAQKSI